MPTALPVTYRRRLMASMILIKYIIYRYLRSVSVLTFLNKIDILKEKIRRGADFGAAMDKIREEAYLNATKPSHTAHDRKIYRSLYDILAENPYQNFHINGKKNCLLTIWSLRLDVI